MTIEHNIFAHENEEKPAECRYLRAWRYVAYDKYGNIRWQGSLAWCPPCAMWHRHGWLEGRQRISGFLLPHCEQHVKDVGFADEYKFIVQGEATPSMWYEATRPPDQGQYPPDWCKSNPYKKRPKRRVPDF